MGCLREESCLATNWKPLCVASLCVCVLTRVWCACVRLFRGARACGCFCGIVPSFPSLSGATRRFHDKRALAEALGEACAAWCWCGALVCWCGGAVVWRCGGVLVWRCGGVAALGVSMATPRGPRGSSRGSMRILPECIEIRSLEACAFFLSVLKFALWKHAHSS